MSTNNLAISVTADVVDLQSKFAIAQAQVRGLTSEMNKLATASAKGLIDPEGSARLQQVAGDLLHARGEAADLAGAMQKAGVSVSGFGNRARAETEGIGGAFQSMSSKVNAALQFTGIAVAVEALHKLMDVVGAASQRANEIRSMSEVLNVTATQFQSMEIAAEEAGIGAEQMFRAEEKLVTILNEARDGSGAAIEKLHALGVSNEQIRDKSFDAAQMIAFLSGRLNDGATAAAEMAAMSKELGARAAIAAAGIKQLGSDTNEWNQRAAAANSLSDAQLSRLHDIGAWWSLVGREISNATSKLVIWSADAIRAADLGGTLGGQMAQALVQPTGGEGQGSVSGKINRDAGADAQSAAQQRLAAETQASNATITKDTLDSIRDQIEATKAGSAERLALVRQFYQDSLAFYANDPTVDKVKEAHRQLVAEERQHGEELKRQAEKNASDLVAATREKASEIMAEEGVSKAQQLAQVRDLYAQELQSATLTKEKRVEVERSLNDAIAAVHREAASTAQAIARSDADTGIAIARLNLAAEKQILDEELAAHQINAAQKFAILQNLATREEALNEQALQTELASMPKEAAEREKVNNQILELQAKLNVDLAALDRQRAAEAKKALDEENQSWKRAVGEIESAESSMIGNLLSGRKSFAASAIQVAQQLLTQELENDVKAITTRLLLDKGYETQKQALEQGGFVYHMLATKTDVATDAAAEAQKTAATRTGVAARTAAEQSGSNGWLSQLGHLIASWFGAETSKTGATTTGVGVRTKEQIAADVAATESVKSTALNEILAYAATGAAAAGASVAAIPIYGWAAAGPTAETTYAELSSFASTLGFDQGAWNIPHDYQGVTVHKGETILPPPFAEEFRRNGGSLGGGDGRGSGDTYGDFHQVNHIHQVMPSAESILGVLSKATRNFHPATRGR